jgi:hypothetical protein
MKLEISIDSKALSAAISRMRGPELLRLSGIAIEKHAKTAREAAVRAFVSRGIGKGIFGRNDSGAWKIITLSPIKVSGGSVSVTLAAGGLAGMQETGGHTRPHEIRPKRAKMLVFAVAGGFGFGGDMAFAKVVHHPGGVVHKHPALVPAAEKIMPLALEDIRKAVVALWQKAA